MAQTKRFGPNQSGEDWALWVISWQSAGVSVATRVNRIPRWASHRSSIETCEPVDVWETASGQLRFNALCVRLMPADRLPTYWTFLPLRQNSLVRLCLCTFCWGKLKCICCCSCTLKTDLYLGLYTRSVVLSVYRALLKPEMPPTTEW